jgi:iron complex outermembrane receptor protein
MHHEEIFLPDILTRKVAGSATSHYFSTPFLHEWLKSLLYPIFLTIIICIASESAIAQPHFGTVSGSVVDNKGIGMEYGTISLLRAADSVIIKGTLSSATGAYRFDHVGNGIFIVKATAVGFTKVTSAPFTITDNQSEIKLPSLIIFPVSKALQTVTVTALRPIIERKIDRTVMNVENSILAAGNSALEILARAPGVIVDKDGNISLNGKGGVNVMINDKMTYLSAAQLAELLKSTDGNTVKSIELMTNPSSKYDASGNSGIINIKLKKNTQAGTNGSLTAGAGYGKHARENATLSLNHKEGNLNFFGTYSHSDSKNEYNLHQQRVVTDSSAARTYFDQRSVSDRVSHNNSYRLGADLSTGSRNTLGVLFNGYFNTYESTGNSYTNIGAQPSAISSSQHQASEKNGHSNNFSFNFNDNIKLDTTGQQLSIDYDYSRFRFNENDLYNTDIYNADGTSGAPLISLRQQTPSIITINSAKLDYVLPLKKAGKLELGAKYSDVKNDNNLLAQRLRSNGYVNDSTLTNHFIYDEKIAAGYANYSQSFGATSIQAGLRAEHTSSEGDLIDSHNDVKRSYLDLFPSLFISRKLDEKNDITLSYSKRVDRPPYDELNPFTYYIDQFSFSRGNPFLNPQYTNKIALDYSYNHSLNVSLGYSHAYNYLTNLALTNPSTKVTEYTTLNLQHQNYYNIAVSSPYSLTKWWTGNANAVAYYSAFKADSLLGGSYDRGLVSVHLQATQYFQLAKTYRAEVMINYDSPFIYGTYRFNHNAYGDIGLSHSFAAKRANLKLSVSDIFNTNKTTMISKFETNDITLHAKSETRIARLTFTYNFGSNMLRVRHHETGADDEKSRAGK